MYLFKAVTEEDHQEERTRLLWQMLTATLERSHERMMSDFGMATVGPRTDVEVSPMRGGVRPASVLRGHRV